MSLTLDNLRPYTTGAEVIGSSPIRNARLWHYTTNDTLVTVAGSNYFNGAASYLGVGDVIMVSADLDGTPAGEHYVVASNNGTTVAVTAFS